MERRPVFSIISVTWRDLAGLQATAASIDGQSDRDFEWIVVDGLSDDGTAQWLAAQNLPYCRWTSEKDAGIFDAMNKGIDRSSGEYFVFMNSGDVFAASTTLAAVRRAIGAAPSRPDLVYGDSIDVQADGNELYRKARDPGWIRYGMFASHQATFFRRDHFPQLRHDLSYPHSGDYGFIAAFLRGGPGNETARCAYLAQPLCRFALGGTHFTGRLRALKEDFRIRRTILRQPLALAALLYAAHRAHHFLKLTVPGLTRRIRYGSAQEG